MIQGNSQKVKVTTTRQNSKVSAVLTFALWFCLLNFAFCLPTASACPGCKEALFEPGKIAERVAIARGYALSIALLLGIPVALLGTIAILLVRARRRALRGSGQV